ncbi:fungal-specific transcription factor domain-containing protein [Stachybotrys elegans]|uniref:Fungal-specific transcription factor domain-containing protein n=1 Tax=Stachybotrys elegans TaxID=80388 RepID=A0A8K0SI99_9HYPO|nr:fungal-specific transcription factor domain-containing protein [Stachybotrys elegans]
MQSPHEDQDVADKRPAKRRRVALACDLCRERKIRCDGAKPICKQCEKRGDDPLRCVYTIVPQSAKQISEQEYISSLQNQVQTLQKVVEDLRRASGNTVGCRDSPHSGHAQGMADGAEVRAVVGSSPAGSLFRASEDVGPSPVSAMGASTMRRGASFGDNNFYGQSSIHSLLREVPNAATRPVVGNAVADNAGPVNDYMMHPRYALPPRQVADKLLDLYFDNVHIFYPWTHSIIFRRRYEALWDKAGYPGPSISDHSHIGLGGDGCPVSAFFCALNSMFALGCEFSDLPDKDSVSATFCGRMRELLYIELFDHGDIAHVQALLLAGHYLLTTELPTRCYNVVGLALRMAVGLGMYSDQCSERYSMGEREIRRRVWYGCLQMEMTVNMTLGRPPLLRMTDDVPLPAAIDDEYLDSPGPSTLQQGRVLSGNLFVVENIRLAKILGMILSHMYSDSYPQTNQTTHVNPPSATASDFSTMTRLDRLLDEFEASLPDVLTWKAHGEASRCGDTVLRRQSNVLQARFLHLRLMLHRPSFTAYCSSARQAALRGEASQRTPNLTAALHAECAKSCVQAAHDLVKSQENAILNNVAGAWWFSLFCTSTPKACSEC